MFVEWAAPGRREVDVHFMVHGLCCKEDTLLRKCMIYMKADRGALRAASRAWGVPQQRRRSTRHPAPLTR